MPIVLLTCLLIDNTGESKASIIPAAIIPSEAAMIYA